MSTVDAPPRPELAPAPAPAAARSVNPWKTGWGRAVRMAAWAIVAVYFVVAAVLLTLRYVVLPQVDRYRPDIERLATQAVKVPVRIQSIDASWTGLYPRLVMSNVTLSDRNGRTALALPRVEAVISWRSLAVAELRLATLQVDAPDLTIQRTADGQLYVAGLPIDLGRRDDEGRLNEWLLAQQEISVRGATLRWIDEQRQAPPLVVTDASFVLKNAGHRHRAAFYARLPNAWSAPIDLRAEFTHGWFARRAGDVRAWQGQLYAQVDQTDLAAWPRYLELPVQLDRGHGAVRAWARFAGGEVEDVTADVALSDVVTRLAPDLEEMRLTAVQGRISAGRSAAGHHFGVQRFSLRTADGQAVGPVDVMERYVAPGVARKESGSFTANGLVLHTLADVAGRLPLPRGAREVLADLRPRGRLDDFSFAWEGPFTAPTGYSLRGRFSELGLEAQPVLNVIGHVGAPHPGIPGFENLSGRVDATAEGGTLQLRAKDAALQFPGVFQEPRLAFGSFDGDIRWTAPAGKSPLSVRIDRLVFENGDVAGTVTGSYRAGGKGPGLIDLGGRLGRADARAVYRYLPLVVPEATRTWLQRALLAGRATETEFRLKGDLHDFPYKDKSGEFRVAAKFEGGRLDYAPTHDGTPSPWLPAEDVKGELVFDRTRMEVRASEARILGVRMTSVVARLPDLTMHPQTLEIEGQGAGPVADMLRYFNTTPIAAKIDHATHDVRATGNGRLTLGLRLPFHNLPASKVNGNVVFQGGDVAFEGDLPPLQRVNGRLDFTETGAVPHGITATFLGGPAKIEGSTRPDRATLIRAEGTATAQGLAQLPGPSLAKRLTGQARYTTTVLIKSGAAPEVHVQSDLLGMAVDFPAPLRKGANETMPFRLDVLPVAVEPARSDLPRLARRDELRLAVGASVAALFERVRDEQTGRMRVARGSIGVNNPPNLPQEGVIALINLPVFELDAWLRATDFGDGAATPGRAQGEVPRLDFVALRAGTMHAFGKKLQNVVVGASRERSVWQVNLESDQISGYATWREASRGQPYGRLTARLARLIIPRESSAELASVFEGQSARNLPGVDLQAEDTELFGRKLGRLQVLADNAQRVWRIQKLAVENPDGTLNASGSWSPEVEGRSRTALHVGLDITDAGKLLARLGIPGAMRGGIGKLEGDINWRGLPYSLDTPTLSGQLALAVDKGQFLKADTGVAKLLGVLSLQSLPRRITLDFRDVFSEGFAYDTIRATIQLQNGVASTQDFKMKGVSATVVIDGSSDLAHETQKLKVLVVPEINAGSASVLYGLVVNPAVGFGTFLAQLLLREPLAKAFTYQYEITGSWVDPHIAKIGREAGRPEAGNAGG